ASAACISMCRLPSEIGQISLQRVNPKVIRRQVLSVLADASDNCAITSVLSGTGRCRTSSAADRLTCIINNAIETIIKTNFVLNIRAFNSIPPIFKYLYDVLLVTQ